MLNKPATGQDTLRRAIAVSDIIGLAARVLAREGNTDPTMNQLIWWALVDAADTERRLPRAGARRGTGGGIEYHHTPSEIFATEREMISDGISYPPSVSRQVSAAEAERHGEVMTWLWFIKGHGPLQRSNNRKLVFALASGIGPKRMVDAGLFGARSTGSVKATKKRALESIGEAVIKIMNGEEV